MRRLVCRLRQSSFVQGEVGPDGRPLYKSQAELDEELFYLVYHGGFSPEWIENLEISRKRYFLNKLSSVIKKHNEEIKKGAASIPKSGGGKRRYGRF